jgi:Mn2+/Fe2+ NRAMP family transporter
MAQTKRKRRSKHRGTAAGTIETRGRTGRPPSADERKQLTRAQAREKRLNTPPTWRSAFLRASLAAMIMFAFISLTSKGHNIAQALVFAVVALLLYVPAGFYMESFLYRRRMRKKELGK